jgi:ribosomal protein S18 acetylase RimI-like enzyme
MADCQVIEALPSPAGYNHLRALVGWGTYAEEVIAQALPRSLYSVCAYRDGELVGMARVIGDGGLVYYVQDVIVVPVCQRQGIGTRMMDQVMGYIRAHAGPNAVVGLMAAGGKEPFYEKYGFTRRPNDRLGAGMTIFWRG